ncbi:MAG: hypothetical protein HYX56_06360 [Chloroflexi bacterium]|nr:hypothetical protein [Chloroflexota bacterium]
MARISYKEGTSSFRRLLNHSPEVSEAYWGLRDALNAGVLTPKIRTLSFLACDITNHCRY